MCIDLTDSNCPEISPDLNESYRNDIECLLSKYSTTISSVPGHTNKLLSREQNYSTIEKECLAIINGIDKFKFYLMGKPFILECDHKPLVYLNKVKGSNARLMRWSFSLQPYKFRCIHINGKDNVAADIISRCC